MNIIVVSIISLGINILLGKYRARFSKMTLMWWLMIHASIPLIVTLRIYLDTPKIAIPLFIILAIIGQVIGGRVFAKNCE